VSTPPSELRARIGAQVRASRQRQGLSPYITDPATVDRLAGRVLELTELALDTLAREEREAKRAAKRDRARRATGRHQGNGRGREATASDGAVLTPDAAVMTPSPEMRNGAPDLGAVPVPVSPATEETHGQHSG
jgi:hypothetical protein